MIMDEITELTSNLFLCGLRPIILVPRYNFDKLKKLGIKLIINVTQYQYLTRWDLSASPEHPDINVVQIPVADNETENSYPYFKV